MDVPPSPKRKFSLVRVAVWTFVAGLGFLFFSLAANVSRPSAGALKAKTFLRGREISRRIMVFILVRPQYIVCETWDAKNRALSESTHRCRMGDRAPSFSRPRQAGTAAAV